MILSFHPCFEADKNIICAGRLPNEADLLAIKKAKAVILPQGCNNALYWMVFNNCKNIFPNFYNRFVYPGKTGQIKLFKIKQIPHPKSWVFKSVEAFIKSQRSKQNQIEKNFPFVFKFDWGGEGETVFLVEREEILTNLLLKAKAFEKSNDFGFIIQNYIKSLPRTLRVVIIGDEFFVYWRVRPKSEIFGEQLRTGAYIEKGTFPLCIASALKLLKKFCDQTGINLAGFDFIFNRETMEPFLLEINYFFGRRGLGGSKEYYKILSNKINKWIINLKTL